MIECNSVCAGYGGKKVLTSASLTVSDGSITALLGRNGSGKSTLLRAIAGNLPYKGSIKLDGIETGTFSAIERAKRLAAMPQLLRAPEITVRELISYGRQPYTGFGGILSRADRAFVDAVIEKTGLCGLADKMLCRVSGGERQKAYFALLLAQDAPNLLLDEPGSQLDAQYTTELCGFLNGERARGRAVLTVLHDVNMALGLADRIAVIDGGVTIFDGTRGEFIRSGIAEDIFGLQKCACIAPDGSESTLFIPAAAVNK